MKLNFRKHFAVALAAVLALQSFSPALSVAEQLPDGMTGAVEQTQSGQSGAEGQTQSGQTRNGVPDEEEKHPVVKRTMRIRTAQELADLAKNCVLDRWSEGLTVLLEEDIDLAGSDFTAIACFGGMFDGQGHTISGFSVSGDGTTMGFFRYLTRTALVRDLHVTGKLSCEKRGSVIGGLAGRNDGLISGCSFEGEVAAQEKAGGIAAVNGPDGMIIQSTFYGSVFGAHAIGGIAGLNQGKILSCVNAGQVNTKLIEVDDNVTLGISDVLAGNFDISSVSNEDFIDILNIGGIAGESEGLIDNCVNAGIVGYAHTGYNVGGIAGLNKGYVSYCRNDGEVNGRKDTGGIVGQIEPETIWDYSSGKLDELLDELKELDALLSDMVSNVAAGAGTVRDQISVAEACAADTVDNLKILLGETVDELRNEAGRIRILMDQLSNAISREDAEGIADCLEQLSETLGQTDFFSQPLAISVQGDLNTDTDADFTATSNAMANALLSLENSIHAASAGTRDTSINGTARTGIGVDGVIPDLIDEFADTASGIIADGIDAADAALDDLAGDARSAAGNAGQALDGLAGEAVDAADIVRDRAGELEDALPDGMDISAEDILDLSQEDLFAELTVENVPGMDDTADEDPVEDYLDDGVFLDELPADDLLLDDVRDEEPWNDFSDFTFGDDALPADEQDYTYDLPEDEEQGDENDLTLSEDEYRTILYEIPEAGAERENEPLLEGILSSDIDVNTNSVADRTGNAQGQSDLSLSGDAAADLGLDGITDTVFDGNLEVSLDDSAFPTADELAGLMEELLMHASHLLDQKALEDARDILEEISFDEPDTEPFYTSFQNLMDALKPLDDNLAAIASNAAVDFKAVTDQLDTIFDTFFGYIDELSELESNVEDDISGESPWQSNQGAVASCLNCAPVSADTNVGGIVGAITFENSFDAEDILNISQFVLRDARKMIFASVRECENRGTITAKKEAAGGIVGAIDYGTAAKCLSSGGIEVSEGDYCGGIAGTAQGVITLCQTMNLLTGNMYTGGIVGKGNDIHSCVSYSEIKGNGSYMGAVAGWTDGDVTGNLYLNRGLGGVDGVSFSGSTDPFTEDQIPFDQSEYSVTAGTVQESQLSQTLSDEEIAELENAGNVGIIAEDISAVGSAAGVGNAGEGDNTGSTVNGSSIADVGNNGQGDSTGSTVNGGSISGAGNNGTSENEEPEKRPSASDDEIFINPQGTDSANLNPGSVETIEIVQDNPTFTNPDSKDNPVVTFMVGDDIYAQEIVPFGGKVTEIPEVEKNGDDYWVWDDFDRDAVFSNITVTGSYHRPITTLSAEGNPPRFLAEGTFYEGQELQIGTLEVPIEDERGDTSVQTAYSVFVTNYEKPLKVRMKAETGGTLYHLKDGWDKQEITYETDGSYLVFNLPNGGVVYYEESLEKRIKKLPLQVKIAIGAGCAGVLLILIVLIRKRRKKRAARKTAK